MKITIQHNDTCRVITLPNGLLFNQGAVRLALAAGRKYAPEAVSKLDTKAIGPVLRELRRVKARYGTWTLVEVRSADGEEVIIEL